MSTNIYHYYNGAIWARKYIISEGGLGGGGTAIQ